MICISNRFYIGVTNSKNKMLSITFQNFGLEVMNSSFRDRLKMIKDRVDVITKKSNYPFLIRYLKIFKA